MNRIIAVCAALAAAISLFATQVQTAVDRFVADSVLRYASVGVEIYDIANGTEIAGYRSTTADIPASNMKTITCATAIASLGPDYRFVTPAKLVGHKQGHKFIGRIVVSGSGDPTIGSKYFADRPDFVTTIVERIAAQGIDIIEGEIVVEDCQLSEAYEVNWNLDDVAWDYGAGSFLFNYADNCFRLPVDIGDSTITAGTSSIAIEGLNVEVEASLYPDDDIRSKGLNVLRGVDSSTIKIIGSTDRRNRSTWFDCAIPQPSEYFKSSLTKAMADRGIHMRQKASLAENSDTIWLVEYQSPTVAEIAKSALERSDNMFTECLLKAIGLREFGIWSGTASVGIVRSYWNDKGIDINQLFMIDGSGLSRRNKVTPLFFGQMLALAQTSGLDHNVNYASMLPRLGEDGTVKTMLKGTPYAGKICMKSGSMSQVLCYSGYYPAESPRYVISVLVNDYLTSYSDMRNRICTFLLNLLPNLDLHPEE
ncbi:MAG: D-alanyl-D-alanine carboxypeptidase/D-alanyl-D-alanine-endopeptidase [Muribaculaceae bacterium]